MVLNRICQEKGRILFPLKHLISWQNSCQDTCTRAPVTSRPLRYNQSSQLQVFYIAGGNSGGKIPRRHRGGSFLVCLAQAMGHYSGQGRWGIVSKTRRPTHPQEGLLIGYLG